MNFDHSAAGVFISPIFMIRLATLPIGFSTQFRAPAVVAAVGQSLAAVQEMGDSAKGLAGRLFDCIKAAGGSRVGRGVLLAIKRDIYNCRSPSPKNLAAAREYIPTALWEALCDWIELVERSALCDREGALTLETWVTANRSQLKKVAADPLFKRSVLLASQAFHAPLDSYLASADQVLSKRDKRTERTLLSYLLRAVHKTSPFAQFTAVSFGVFADDCVSKLPLQNSSPTFFSRSRPNLEVLSLLRAAIEGQVGGHPHLLLSLGSTFDLTDGHYRFLRRVESKQQLRGGTTAIVELGEFRLLATQLLDKVVETVGACGSISIGDLKSELTYSLSISPPVVDRYIQSLVETGFLVVKGLRPWVLDTDYWLRFANQLSTFKGDIATHRSASALLNVLRSAQSFNDSTGESSFATLTAIRSAASDALLQWQSTDRLPETIIYEDTGLVGQPLRANRSFWVRALQPFAPIQRLLSLFDHTLVSRLALSALFVQRYGPAGVCDDVQAFAEYFLDVFFREFVATATEGWPRSIRRAAIGGVTEVDAARDRFVQWHSAACRSADRIAIVPDTLIDEVGYFSFEHYDLLSNSVYFQALVTNDLPTIILNHVYGGSGASFARFLHLVGDRPEIEGRMRQSIIEMNSFDSTLVAELQGAYHNNLNNRPPIAPFEIVLPNESSRRAPRCRLSLSDLILRHNQADGRISLHRKRDDRRVVPVYTGSLYPPLLPDLCSFLLHFGPPHILDGHVALNKPTSAVTANHRPRITYRNIVIEREAWLLEDSFRRALAQADGDYAFIVELNRWRIKNGAPSEVFVHMLPGFGGDNVSRVVSGGQALRKPFYLDFDNPLSTNHFRSQLSAFDGALRFTECLPSSRQADQASSGLSRVSEYVAEVVQTSRNLR
ncbi:MULTISPECIES: lantibiotic dehydratase [unclassified Mesorhizobium]|uniref:lantibiotic dehydratase n=1 Tax=unclassified Mesorhizobium TaxID=325217 RepID=UPI00040F13E6|nr:MULTISPECIES: lantibiotic dehydratase [unclassified Mesorhizobium]WJI81251.1 lantibiotic dehydratase family protein [Mesorhizobium sp. C374B]WJI87770.1 lantibiotic dehydratase family protein [Mesorhizobium sp. C372A]